MIEGISELEREIEALTAKGDEISKHDRRKLESLQQSIEGSRKMAAFQETMRQTIELFARNETRQRANG